MNNKPIDKLVNKSYYKKDKAKKYYKKNKKRILKRSKTRWANLTDKQKEDYNKERKERRLIKRLKERTF